MSDQTSTLLIRLLSTGDLSALTKGKEASEALRISTDGLKRALEGLGVGLTFAAALEGVKNAVAFGSAINDLSIQAGISAQAFQTLAYTADAAGVKQDELGGALNILQRNLAQAATGATKQNQAIADLGMSTAELLAMPVEKQVEAIGRAYVNAADKGVAWAAVVALIGKNSTKLKEVLQEVGEKGMGALDRENPLKLSDADIGRLDKIGDWWTKLLREIKTVGTMGVARPGDALMTLMGHQQLGAFVNGGKDPAAPGEPEETEAQRQRKIDAIREQLAATIAAEPQMIAAHRALTKALQEEGKAYELPAAAAERLRKEARNDEFLARSLADNNPDIESQLEAVKLRTEAAKLRAQANAVEQKDAEQRAKFNSEELDFYAKLTALELKGEPIQDQLLEARAREVELVRQLDGLSESSLTHDQDARRIQGDILAVKGQIVALDERAAALRVSNEVALQENRTRMQSIALAAIEADYSTTDAEKWEERRVTIGQIIKDQEQYVAYMRELANDPTLTQTARDRAADEADRGETGIADLNQSLAGMGPNPQSFAQNMKAELTSLRSQWGTLEQQMARGLTGTISNGVNSAVSNVVRLARGFQDVGTTIRNVAIDIGVTLAESFAAMGVKWVANKIMMATADKAIAAGSAAALIPIASAQSAIWTPPATLATIASWGGAAVAAPFQMAGALAASQALALAGFKSGGFTGMGGDDEVAGFTHKNEFVWSAPAVRAIGAGNLERAHKAALGGGGGVSAGGGASGAPGNIILAMSPEDVARSQRKHVDARVVRFAGKHPKARVAL